MAAILKDTTYSPQNADRIRIDFSINDIDSGNAREGILTYSPGNQDLSWKDVSRWSYTWIWDISTNIQPGENNLPGEFELYQNYPNPFNPATVIGYRLPVTGHVEIEVYDILGNKIAELVNGNIEAGRHEVLFNASSIGGAAKLSSGTYFITLKTKDFFKVRKCLLIK